MKKLFASPKFWAITFGATFGSAIYYFLGDGVGLDNSFPVVLIGLYGTIAGLDKVKDITNAYKQNKQDVNN